MKKSILLIAAGMIALGANAKDAKQSIDRSATKNKTAGVEARVPGSMPTVLTPELAHAAKATNTVIGTVQTFNGSLAGWSSSAIANTNTFVWGNTGIGFIPDLNSPSAADGWAQFDANGNNASIAEAEMHNTTAFNMSGHSNVGLVFNEWWSRFEDSCRVDISLTSAAGPWTSSHEVFLNNTISSNGETRNTDTVVIALPEVANQATVYIRFHYYAPSNAYGWAIDDVRFVDLDALNVKSHHPCVLYPVDVSQNFFWGTGTIPKQFMDSLAPLTFVYNQAYQAQATYNVNASITGGPAYNHSFSITNLAVNGYDSIADFTGNFYHPTTSGNYSCVFSGTGGLADTVRFALSDSAWTNYATDNVAVGGYYLHRSSNNASGEHSWNFATRFFVPGGKSDTLTSIQGVFASSTSVGSQVMFLVYKFNTTTNTWDIAGKTYSRLITAADKSPSGGPYVLSKGFFPDSVFNNGPLIVSGDVNDGFTQFAVVATTDHTDPADTTVIIASEGPQFTNFFGVSGLYDDGDNQATSPWNVLSETFNNNLANTTNHTPWAFEYTPMIQANFGTINPNAVNINNVAKLISADNAYPNPAKNNVTVSFLTAQNANAVVTLQNAVGQVIKTQNLGALNANETGKAVFATSDMANGLYFYTINANGVRKTGRFVVAH